MLRRSKLSIFSTKLQYRWIFRKIAPNIIQDKIISSCKLQFVLKREKKREKIISTTIHSHVKFSSPNRLARNFLQVAASLASIPIEIPKSVFPVHEHRVEKPPLGGDAHGDSVKFTGTRPFTYSGEGKRGLALWPRRKYEISRDANPFPTGKGGGRPLPEAYDKLARAVETSRECQISKRSLQISVQINYYPRRSTCLSPSSLSLSYASLCLRPSFSRWNPSLPRFHPLLSTFYEASLRIQTRQPSTSTTIHRRRLRRLTLLEMQRLRRMFENVFSPSFLLSLSFLRVYIYVYSPRVPREGNPAWQMEISRPTCCQKCWRNALVFHPVANVEGRRLSHPSLSSSRGMMMERSPSCVSLEKEEWMREGSSFPFCVLIWDIVNGSENF